MSVKNRGFGSLKKTDPERLRDICSKAGKQAHKIGAVAVWDSASAREAGRKGGLASQATRRAKRT